MVAASGYFWRDKRVLVTGHTGFKGSWLCLLLNELGAELYGYALRPVTSPALYDAAGIEKLLQRSYIGDIRDREALTGAIREINPELTIHLAAQSLVVESYRAPVDTFGTNLMGTVQLLDALRSAPAHRAGVIVSSDKCYANEHGGPFSESDRLGGIEPYSSSKACVEIATHAMQRSFPELRGVATARGGNVIGGGDWSAHRLVPDCIRAIERNEPIALRNPDSERPWQHVLDCLNGYLVLAERLYADPLTFSGPYNFGPGDDEPMTVRAMARQLAATLGHDGLTVPAPGLGAEQPILSLNSSKARRDLGWSARWSAVTAVSKTAEWFAGYRAGAEAGQLCRAQIAEHRCV